LEVGPRDGLQNEAAIVALAAKVTLVERLADAGLQRIEAGSFVSPRWVPQMADSAAVFAGVAPRPGMVLSALVPNMAGLDRAIAAGLREVAVFGAASEAFSQRNINCSMAESLGRFRPVVQAAVAGGMRVRGYVSCALGCPYEGEVAVEAVVGMSRALAAMGCAEIGVSDTIGVGTALQARRVVGAVADAVGVERVAVHFHDTYGQALANILACLELGVAVVDSAVAGLGGCPYARGATGNVATEDVVYMLHGMGIQTGIDLDRLCAVGAEISAVLGRQNGSRVGSARARAGAPPVTAAEAAAR
jgi:hydroxymethylglutaryl-CoA lyase